MCIYINAHPIILQQWYEYSLCIIISYSDIIGCYKYLYIDTDSRWFHGHICHVYFTYNTFITHPWTLTWALWKCAALLHPPRWAPHLTSGSLGSLASPSPHHWRSLMPLPQALVQQFWEDWVEVRVDRSTRSGSPQSPGSSSLGAVAGFDWQTVLQACPWKGQWATQHSLFNRLQQCNSLPFLWCSEIIVALVMLLGWLTTSLHFSMSA